MKRFWLAAFSLFTNSGGRHSPKLMYDSRFFPSREEIIKKLGTFVPHRYNFFFYVKLDKYVIKTYSNNYFCKSNGIINLRIPINYNVLCR